MNETASRLIIALGHLGVEPTVAEDTVLTAIENPGRGVSVNGTTVCITVTWHAATGWRLTASDR